MFTEVDFTYDTDLHAEIGALENEYPGLRVTVLEEHGPAGGWPVIRLEADQKTLVKVLKEHWQAEDEELWPTFGVPTWDNRFAVTRTTTDKLQEMLNSLGLQNWSRIEPHFTGGRDWVVVCQRD